MDKDISTRESVTPPSAICEYCGDELGSEQVVKGSGLGVLRFCCQACIEDFYLDS